MGRLRGKAKHILGGMEDYSAHFARMGEGLRGGWGVILRHCGLWEGAIRTLASLRAPPRRARRAPNAACELELVPDAEFLVSQRLESRPVPSRELQLVLDPGNRGTAGFHRLAARPKAFDGNRFARCQTAV